MTPTLATDKGIRTRSLILETAIKLFREQGYEATTVRAIAKASGVAVGNAYYYFGSKEELILAFYERLSEEQNSLVGKSVANSRSLRDRLVTSVRQKLGTLSAHRALCLSLFSIAARPDSVLSPFSHSTEGIRERAIDSFRLIVEGSDATVPSDMRQVLPKILWLYYMAVLFYWLHDNSPLQHKTNELLESSAQMISTLISISSLPVMAPVRQSLLQLFTKFAIPS